MDQTNEWTRRVDEMTASTAHVQLREIVRDAQEMLRHFNDSASENGGLLLDAQRDLEQSMERKMAELSADVTASIAAIRQEISSIQAPTSPENVQELRSEAFAGLAAMGEDLDREMQRLREDLTNKVDQIAARMGSMEDAHARLEARIERAQSSAEERFDALAGQLERTAGMEQRAAALMVDLLATAFAGLRNGGNPEPNGKPHLVAASEQR